MADEPWPLYHQVRKLKHPSPYEILSFILLKKPLRTSICMCLMAELGHMVTLHRGNLRMFGFLFFITKVKDAAGW